jgi:YD repeat-containing protein
MLCGRLRAAMIASSLLLAAASPPTGGGRATAGDPVDLATGLNVREHEDIVIAGEPKIELHRTFGGGWGSRSRAFGIATSHEFDVFLVAAGSEEATKEMKRIDLVLPDGGRIPFVRTSPGTGHTGAVLMHAGSPSAFHGSRLRWTDPGWELDLVNGSHYTFPACGAGVVRAEQCALAGYRDGQGRSLTFDRDANGDLRRVSSGWFRGINFRYDSAHRIVRADTGWGLSMTTVDYAYDAGGHRASVKSRQLSAWSVLLELIYAYQTTQLPSLARMSIRYDAEYTYDEQHRLRRVREPGLELDHEYDAAGRVIKQHVKGWGAWTFTYTQGADGKVTQTDLVDPDGLHRRVVFNADGYPQSDATSPGQPDERVTRFEHAPGGNIVAQITVECRSVSGAPVSVTAPVDREPPDAVEDRLLDQCEQRRAAASRLPGADRP